MTASPLWRPTVALYRDVRGHNGRDLLQSALLMGLGALAEGAGLLILLPMLSLVSNERKAGLRWAPSWLGEGLALPLILALFLFVMVARAAILLARDRATARLEASYDANLRLRTASALATGGWPLASSIGQAGLQGLLANDVPRASAAVHFGLNSATLAVLLAIQLVVAAWLSWPMALAAMALLLAGLPLLVRLARRSQLSGQAITAGQVDSARAAHGFQAGLKAALAQGSVQEFLDAYAASLARLSVQLVHFVTALARSRARHSIAAAAAVVALVVAGQWLRLDLPRLLTLVVLFARMSGPAQALQQALASLVAYTPAFVQIERLVGPLGTAPPPALPSIAPMDWHNLAADGVALDRGGGTGLAPISFTLARGEWLALTGESGAGKTSLVDLVAGLLAPTAGTLAVDGAPLDQDRFPEWRASLAYVGQQAMPFEATVRAALGPAEGDRERWSVLAEVGLAELIRERPESLDSPLDDGGARLSGGER
ncbi:MAG: ABC transporter ATP-binding protein, partial [Sphingomicrobium sp.]